MTWNKQTTGGTGSNVTSSSYNGKVRVDGQEITVYDDTNIQQSLNNKANVNHKHTLTDITDVDITNKTNGYALIYDSTSGKYKSQPLPSGSGSGTVTTTSNFVTSAFVLCGDILFQPNANQKSITVSLNLDLSLNRIMIVNYSNGTSSQISIPNPFTLQDTEYMLWDATNGFQTKSQTTGISVPYNAVLVAMNWGGKITGGILFDLYNKRFPMYEREYSIKFTETAIPSGHTYHSMFVCDNQLITLEAPSLGSSSVFSLTDLSFVKSFNVSFIETNADLTTSEMRLVASDFNPNIRALIMGNSTSSLTEEHMKGYIFYNADTWKDATGTVTFDTCGLYTKLDFLPSIFPGQQTAKLCWAAEDDMCYLTNTDLQYIHKLLLGTGTNNLGSGTYSYDPAKRYNGTYKIIQSYTQDLPKYGNKDLQFYRGNLWYPLKYTSGGYKVLKAYLNSGSGTIKYDLIYYNPIGQDGLPLLTGSPEGIVIYNGKVYCGHATYPKIYTFDAF